MESLKNMHKILMAAGYYPYGFRKNSAGYVLNHMPLMGETSVLYWRDDVNALSEDALVRRLQVCARALFRHGIDSWLCKDNRDVVYMEIGKPHQESRLYKWISTELP
jgi:hypothetical protein